MFLEDEELNNEPNRGIGIDDFNMVGLDAAARRRGANGVLMSVVFLEKNNSDLKNVENGGSFMSI